MAVEPGQSLQQYRLTEKIGEGGMGQVWRAVDSGLDREVAVKILPEAVAGHPERLARFEREAKAVAALAHPNILAVYDFGREGPTTFMVTELLDGETLRDRLATGPLPARKAAELARQIARGLAAAHQKGFVHRDLKPENVFVTVEGRAKILDFGLAASSFAAAGAASDATHTPTATGLTSPGSVVGTADYMSPEQVRGEPVDHRSDLFSFGTLLHEMLTGARPFRRDTAAETMTAILREDPPEPGAEGAPQIPSALERVVRRCLEKRPEERFQSASDLAFAVENALGTTSATVERIETPGAPVAGAGARRIPWLAAAAVVVVLSALAFVAGRLTRSASIPQPVYDQLTFREGLVSAARFAADGRTVVYSAAWDGGKTRLYTVNQGSPESRPLDIEDVELLSVSSQGELAILLHPRYLTGWTSAGTLARIPLGGGAPRELLENIGSADWDPAGRELAVTRMEGGLCKLEYPPGKELYRTPGWISNVRFSPDGRRLAFGDHPGVGDNRGYVAVADLEGNAHRIGDVWSAIQGVAWSPDGREILFTAGVRGTIRELRATTLGGVMRLLSSAPVDLRLHDVMADGRVLVSRNTASRRIVGRTPGMGRETGLSWLDWSFPNDISADGSQVLFTEQGEGGGPFYSTYMRPTTGGPAVLLGDGQGQSFSPDGKRVLSVIYSGDRSTAVIYPTGAGEAERIELPGFGPVIASWTPDPRKLLVLGSREGAAYRVWLFDLDTRDAEPASPEGIELASWVVDQRGGRFTGAFDKGPLQVFSLDGSDPVVLEGVDDAWRPLDFGGRGETLFLAGRGRVPLPIVRYEIATGKRETLWELAPAEQAGLIDVGPADLTPDGRGYLYSYRRYLSTLYSVDGL